MTGNRGQVGRPRLCPRCQRAGASEIAALFRGTAQLIELAQWMRKRAGAQKVRLESRGIRTEAIALVAAGLQPDLFSEVVAHEGMSTLAHLLQVPVTFPQAPELFCLDLYKEFDIDRLAAIAAPAEVSFENSLKAPQR